jgi:hypothetical protein
VLFCGVVSFRASLAAVGAAGLLLAPLPAANAQGVLRIEPKDWRLVESESGPVNYYRVVKEGESVFLRSSYTPPTKTAVMGWQAPDAERERIRKVAWTWRARTLPRGADECTKGKGDSAAVVYLTFKRGLRYYTLKYAWSAAAPRGKVCGKKRTPFVAQDTVILESGASGGAFRSVELDLSREYRRHFEDGDANADVPPFVGIGVMSDGDQTGSESSADFGTFTLTR